jgi:hypothetical protein
MFPRHRRQFGSLEDLEARNLMAADDVAPQFAIKHPPRLQLGDAPLSGSPAFTGRDQAELIWQTVPAGIGIHDSFLVEYQRAGDTNWQTVSNTPSVDTQVEGRVLHHAILTLLEWNSFYRYRVTHLRAGAPLATYSSTFRTRPPAGDHLPFAFAAYGDSAWWEYVEQFRGVQRQINEHDVTFALLLGDNIYPHGTHAEADARFDPAVNPEAVRWNASHIDFAAVGNHDLDTPEAARQLFSLPIPIADQTAPVDLPPDDSPEFTYSFEYGNAHIVVLNTWMSNLVETDDTRRQMDEMLDFAVATLQDSAARWKLVVAHNPFIGTDKNRHPNEYYFQSMVRRLNSVGVDLVMSGDSHTYAWTYPIAGFDDADANGDLTYDEIRFLPDQDQMYEKGDGLVQLVSGVGGRDFRLGDYTEPVYAKGYSLRDWTGPIEFGFAKVEVSERELVVSYISATTGGIVGDLDNDGQLDANEPFFGQFRIVNSAISSGDLNGDGGVTVADVDLLCLALHQPDPADRLDLNQDRQIDSNDLDHLLYNFFSAGPGDSNLDGIFTSSDLVLAFQNGGYEDMSRLDTRWSHGDWDCDGRFTTRDLVAAFQRNRYLRI